jgi:hypothetical protein
MPRLIGLSLGLLELLLASYESRVPATLRQWEINSDFPYFFALASKCVVSHAQRVPQSDDIHMKCGPC